MKKIFYLQFNFFKKNLKDIISFSIILFISLILFNSALIVNNNIDKAYNTKFDILNTGNVFFNIPKAYYNNNKKEVIENAKELFRKVNLSENTIRKSVNKVSGGEAQRAGIVRAAINKPVCLFADEPTGALNSETGKAVLDVFTTLNNDGQSIIMVTHDKKSALRGNRIIYLKDGKIFGELRLDKYIGDSEERNQKLDKFLKDMGW